jgi:hypothetical protein
MRWAFTAMKLYGLVPGKPTILKLTQKGCLIKERNTGIVGSLGFLRGPA